MCLCLVGLVHGAPNLSVEFVVEALPLAGFASISNDLSRYLLVSRKSEARTARFGTLAPIHSNDFDSNELKFAPIRPPEFTLNPAWFAFGARAHFRVSPAFGLLAEALFALATDRQDAFDKWYLTDPSDAKRYLGTLSVQARDQGSGTAALFSAGFRLQHPRWVFFGIQPYFQATAGGGPLIGYTTTSRYLAVMYENWVAGGPTAFSNFQQTDLRLVHTLSDDVSITRTLTGSLFRFQVKGGFAFAVDPHWTARIELGFQGFGLWVHSYRVSELVNRGEFATTGLLIDPVTYLPTDFLDYPGTAVTRSEATFSRFLTGIATAVSVERRF